jgi:hypothetical protein
VQALKENKRPIGLAPWPIIPEEQPPKPKKPKKRKK